MSENLPRASELSTKRLEFGLRGQEMNRIEAVSDVVFGFALTLLVVSLEVPRTYADLLNVMRGFPAFALTFALLMVVWSRHYYFFRYYGLDDAVTIALNTLLLFVVLFYVYPLKFLFNIWLSPLTGMPMQISNAQGARLLVMGSGDSRGIMLIFGSGFAALYLVFGAMYWHAYRLREALRLTTFEIAYTLTSMVSQFLNVAVALLSILAALMLKPEHAGNAGYVYLLSPILLNVQGTLWRRRKRALELSPQPL
jgi:hypothetical protein